MVFSLKQILLLISVSLFFIELYFYLNIKNTIKGYDSDNDILIQLKSFFAKLVPSYEFFYIFIYFGLLFAGFYFYYILYVVIFIQVISAISDIYIYFLLKNNDVSNN